jgi:hypothetical protein
MKEHVIYIYIFIEKNKNFSFNNRVDFKISICVNVWNDMYVFLMWGFNIFKINDFQTKKDFSK